MYVSKIYIQDNFVPDISTDQFRRKVFGVEVTLKEGDQLEDAISIAENEIREYIKANKVEHPHIEIRNIVENTEEIDNEYKLVEEKLNGFEFKEDAEEYLLTTSFKHFVPAKKIVNSKPNK